MEPKTELTAPARVAAERIAVCFAPVVLSKGNRGAVARLVQDAIDADRNNQKAEGEQ